MKKLISTLLFIFIATCFLNAQQNNTNTNTYTFWNADMQAIAKPESKEGWIYFKNTVSTPPQSVFTTHAAAFGLGVNDQMILESTKTDNLGWTHYTFKQKHNNVEVYGTYYFIHQSTSGELKGNGNVYPNLTVSTSPAITEQTALNNALTEISAQTYSWQNAALEQELKIIKNDSLATYYPSGNLAIYNNELVYYFDVSFSTPYGAERIFINSLDASVIDRFSLIQNCTSINAEMYESNSLEPLNVTINGTNIYQSEFNCPSANTVSNISGRTLFSNLLAIDGGLTNASMISESNPWLNNPVANSTHKHLYTILEFFHNRYGREGMNNNGDMTIQKVVKHYLPYGGYDYVTDLLTFGYTKNNIGIATTHGGVADIVGHEVTHGIIHHTANLDYLFESAAIHESIADIFGYITEANSTGTLDWLVGEDQSTLQDFTYRNMSNPNATPFEDADTYLGNFWDYSSNHLESSHTNNGVMNYWYYLLSDGGTGVNDNSFAYNISPIGYLETADIVYRALSYYLGQTSNYHDARQATVQATADIYGTCSVEVIKVMDAWDAVGVLDNANGTAQISNTVTWNTNKTVAANISIENGGHLIIDNATIDFYPNRGITVEPGGVLTINGATLTNASCSPNAFWKGITVKCDPVLWQLNTPSGPSMPIIAGKVNVTNNSIIENAHIGIAAFTEQEIFPGVFGRFQGGSVWAEGGSIFRNCNESIAYGWGSYDEDGYFIATNSQKVDDCIFECTAPLTDPLYANKASKVFVSKWGLENDNLNITNNKFRNIGNFGPNDKGIGIQALTGGFDNIFGNVFQNLSMGIEIANTRNIELNSFVNVEKGIYLMGIANIKTNFFNAIPTAIDDLDATTIDDTYGIFYTLSSFDEDIEISGNTFEGNPTNASTGANVLHSYGIIAENINTMTQRLSIYKNTFEGLDIAIQSQGDNNALLIKCNEFGINNNPQLITGLYVYDQIHNIGEDCFDNDHPGGNQWFDNCGSGNSDKKVTVDGNATAFEHWTHTFALGDNPNNSSTNPKCSGTTLNIKHHLFVCDGVVNQLQTKVSSSCSDPFAGWRMGTVPNGTNAVVQLINQTIGERDVHIISLNNLQIQLINPEIQNQLVRQIAEEYNKIDVYNVKIANLYLENNDKIGYENFMESTQSAASKMELAIHYLKDEEFVEAQRVLQEIIMLNRPSYLYSNINAELRYNMNKEFQTQINSLYIDLKDSNRSIIELAADEKTQLEDIKNAHIPASLEAEKILSLNGVTMSHHPIKKGLAINSSQSNFDYQLTLLPNPTDVSATVLFSLPPNVSDVQVLLFDIYQNSGMQLQRIEVDEYTNSATINTSNLSTGIYLVYLQVRGVGVASEQLIVIH